MQFNSLAHCLRASTRQRESNAWNLCHVEAIGNIVEIWHLYDPIASGRDLAT